MFEHLIHVLLQLFLLNFIVDVFLLFDLLFVVLNELTLVLTIAHDAVEQWALKILWIKTLVQTDHLYCLFLWQNIQKAFTSIWSWIYSSPEIIFHVVHASFVVSDNSCCFILLLFVNLISKSIDFLHKEETLFYHIVRLYDLNETLDVSVLTISI